jgi:hypothetical protein
MGVARSEWSGLSSHDIDVSPKGMGAARPYQSVEVISRVERTAVRCSLHRMVRWRTWHHKKCGVWKRIRRVCGAMMGGREKLRPLRHLLIVDDDLRL